RGCPRPPRDASLPLARSGARRLERLRARRRSATVHGAPARAGWADEPGRVHVLRERPEAACRRVPAEIRRPVSPGAATALLALAAASALASDRLWVVAPIA